MTQPQIVSDYKYGFKEPEKYVFKSKKGLRKRVVQQISWQKNEPAWMTDFRLKSLAFFEARPLPTWGGDLSKINFNDIYYYIKPTDKKAASWEELPAEIKRTYDRIGIPEAEKKMLLGGVSAQYECITGDALIFGNPHITQLKKIKPGMIVYALNEKAKRLEKQRVKRVMHKGVRPVYRIKVAGREIRCTENHPLYVLRQERKKGRKRGKFSVEWEYLKNLSLGDYIAIVKDLPHEGNPFVKYISKSIGFTPIKEISFAGEEDVYDVEVEGHHNFVANGIIVHNSEVVYKSVQKSLAKKGVIFLDMDSGLAEHPEIVRQYFGTIIPPNDNKFAALNSAVWSGGSFVYVPKGVHVELPLQAYFRINAANMGQFERTLIIAEEGSYVHYVEGCLPAGEQVSRGDSWGNIESIKPGDKVVGEDGNLHRVRATMVRDYRGDLIVIKPISPYNTFRLTPEHPILVIKRNKVGGRIRHNWLSEVATSRLLQVLPQYIKAGELDRGDLLVFPKVKSQKTSATGNELSDDEIVLLGYYLAEGSTYIHNKLKVPIVSFSCGEKDKQLVEDVKEKILKITGKRPMEIIDRRKNSVEVRVYSQKLRHLCLAHCGKLATDKRLSPQIMSLSPEKIRLFLSSYWQGDGNILRRKGSTLMRSVTASEKLAQQLQELFAKIGIYCSIQVRHGGEDYILGRKIYRRTQYILVYTPNKKWSKVRETENYFLVPIEEIRIEKYKGPVFNLDVNGPNSYLVRGFIVHNCTAPVYSTDSLHAAVVEIIVKKGARVRYTTVQNWSTNVYNLVTKRMRVEEEGFGEWIDCNIGCVAAGTMIFTNPNGPKPISRLQEGDTIYTMNLNTFLPVGQKVVAVRPTGKKLLYRLITQNFREIMATENHPFLTLNKQPQSSVFRLAWKPLVELKVGDYIAISHQLPDDGNSRKIQYTYPFIKGSKLKVKPVLPKESSEELMWLLGLYLGDGFIEREKSGRPRRVYFAVPEGNRARESLVLILKKLFNVDWRPKGLCLTIGSSLLADFILALGFDGTAKSKHIPSWIWSLPISEKLSFIEGYLDADGYIRKAKNVDGVQYGQIVFASAHKGLLEQLKLLMITCGLNPLKISAYEQARTLYEGRKKVYTTYYLTLNIRDNLAIIRTKKRKINSIEFVPIRSIDPLREEVVYDLETEATHNFIANGVIVHNSKLTMKYPSLYLMGKGARGEVLSIAYAGKGQHQDAGSKAIHVASNTTSKVTSKSVSKGGGRTSYRGLVQVYKGAKNAKSKVVCDALILDEQSRSDTYPTMKIEEDGVQIEHEATVSKVGEEQLFYLTSRGLSPSEAEAMVVNGFIEPVVKELPMEYAVEMNRLIQLEMQGSVG